MYLSIVYFIVRCSSACVSRDVYVGIAYFLVRYFSVCVRRESIWDYLMGLYCMEVALGKYSLLFSTDGIYHHLLDGKSKPWRFFVIFMIYLFTQNFPTIRNS